MASLNKKTQEELWSMASLNKKTQEELWSMASLNKKTQEELWVRFAVAAASNYVAPKALTPGEVPDDMADVSSDFADAMLADFKNRFYGGPKRKSKDDDDDEEEEEKEEEEE